MPTRDEYREKAGSCLSPVEELRDPIERLKLLEIAGGYLVLSRHVSQRHGTSWRRARCRGRYSDETRICDGL